MTDDEADEVREVLREVLDHKHNGPFMGQLVTWTVHNILPGDLLARATRTAKVKP